MGNLLTPIRMTTSKLTRKWQRLVGMRRNRTPWALCQWEGTAAIEGVEAPHQNVKIQGLRDLASSFWYLYPGSQQC